VSAPLLAVHDVRQGFGHGTGRFTALDGVGLEVARGETLGLVGESGCGKSTLARAIMLMQRPDGGRIEFDGRDVTNLRGPALRRHRRRVQMVFQDPNDSLDPRFAVGRSIAEPLRAQRVPGSEIRRRVAEVLVEVGLSADVAGRAPHEFSGGQRQRIAIARAMVVRPEFLVLDEPTSALDVSVQAQILNLLVRLQDEHRLSYLFVSHDLAVVHHLAHRISVMRAGRIVETGPAPQLVAEPRHEYTRTLLAAVPHLPV